MESRSAIVVFRRQAFRLAVAFCALSALDLRGGDVYVAVEDPNAGDTAVSGRGSEALPYRTLQAAMEHEGLAAGDTVWVKRGTYAEGGITYSNSTVTINRVVVKKGVKMISVDGAASTIIKGATGTRCVYLCDEAEVRGFTLADGRTTSSSDSANAEGGAVLGREKKYTFTFDTNEGAVIDCLITNCVAVGSAGRGGANCGKSLFIRCHFVGCSAAIGAISATGGAQFYNCLFENASTYMLYQAGTTVNCTFVGSGGALRSCFSSHNSIFSASMIVDKLYGSNQKFKNCHARCASSNFPEASRCDADCTFAELENDSSGAKFKLPLFGNFAPMRETTAYRSCTNYNAYVALFPEKYRDEAPYDLYGNPRVTPGETSFDAGCVELDETRWYVDADHGSDDYAGSGKGTASHPYKTLQAAMENPALGPGQIVVAMPGVYNLGGSPYADGAVTNRVSVPDDVTLESAAGSAMTVIEGAPAVPGAEGNDGLGAGAVRAVYLGNNSVVRGFTIRNGFTKTDDALPYYGGGVYGTNMTCSFVFDCNITNCFASRGGAVSRVTANRCKVSGCGAGVIGILHSSFLYNCVVGGQKSGVYNALYCNRVVNCSFLSAAGCSLAVHYGNTGHGSYHCKNSLFCYTVPDYQDYTCCAFATNGGVNVALMTSGNMGDGAVFGLKADFKIDGDGSVLSSDSTLVDRGRNSLYWFFDRGNRDALGVPRALNKNIDIGASEYDWRNDFKAALCDKARFAVVDASSNVVLNASGSVRIDGAGSLSVAWTNVSDTAKYHFTSATEDGVLNCAVNGGAAQAVANGEHFVESAERRVQLDFCFAGGGHADLSSFRRRAGMLIIFQ